ncbi:MAG: 5-formyltetrahydrofolate cyclo-ligase [Prevotellaceae bacterium]|nr:5-formyltetrahydrofolate cyclo-ligase [Prevotellaceae bacterium]
MKSKLRKSIKALKDSYSDAELAALSRSIVAEIMADADVKKAKVIAAYYSLPDEVCTHQLVDKLSRQGKTVLLPAIVDGDLELHQYQSATAMVIGEYNILEPDGSAFTALDKIDLILVPGMAFDSKGNRLGRGKGYYDRLLPKMPEAIKIGVCFPFQLLPSIPTEPHDVRMTKVISGSKS